MTLCDAFVFICSRAQERLIGIFVTCVTCATNGHRSLPQAARREGLAMIAPSAGVQILVARQPVDFRKGADGLAVIARHALGQDPFAGTVIVFRARRGDRVKLLVWDGTDLVLVWKRLESIDSSGRRSAMERFGCRQPSWRYCWSGWTGGTSPQPQPFGSSWSGLRKSASSSRMTVCASVANSA
jgi:hypothetical protein